MECATYVHFEKVGIGMKLLCLLFILYAFLIRWYGKFAIFIVEHCLFFGGETKLEIFFKITYLLVDAHRI